MTNFIILQNNKGISLNSGSQTYLPTMAIEKARATENVNRDSPLFSSGGRYIEIVQWWIVRSHWDSETLKWTKSSKDCVSDLNWPSLSTRRIFLTSLFLFNVIHGQVISKLKDHLLPQSDITRSHKLSFRTISSTINSYRYSLLVNGIFLWNKIPSHVVEAGNFISKFKQALLHR